MLPTQASQETSAPVTEKGVPAPSSGSGSGASTSEPVPGSPGAPNPPMTAPSKGTPNQAALAARASVSMATAHTQPAPEPSQAKPAPQPAETVPAGPSKQEIAQARERMIQLDAKADADRAGIQQIRSQQQAQGLDMRGDILAALNRMNAYLKEASRTLN